MSLNCRVANANIHASKDVVDRYREQLKDVGKSCIRYRKPEQLDFAVVKKLLEETVTSPAEICP